MTTAADPYNPDGVTFRRPTPPAEPTPADLVRLPDLPTTRHPDDGYGATAIAVVVVGAEHDGTTYRVVGAGHRDDTPGWLVYRWTRGGWAKVYDWLEAATPEQAAQAAHRAVIGLRPQLPAETALREAAAVGGRVTVADMERVNALRGMPLRVAADGTVTAEPRP